MPPFGTGTASQWTPRVGANPNYPGIPSNMAVVNKEFYLPEHQLPEGAQRYSQATSPWSTFFRQLERAYTPWGPAVHDAPAAGFAGGPVGTVGRMVPRAGGLIGAIEAAINAGKNQGQWFAQPEESWINRALGVLGNTLGLVPSPIGGEAMNMARMGVGGIRALMGAPEYFNRNLGEAAVSGVGTGARSLWDQYRDTTPSIPSNTYSWPANRGGIAFTGGQPSLAPRWAGSGELNVNKYLEPGENPFANPETGFIPSWAR